MQSPSHPDRPSCRPCPGLGGGRALGSLCNNPKSNAHPHRAPEHQHGRRKTPAELGVCLVDVCEVGEGQGQRVSRP